MNIDKLYVFTDGSCLSNHIKKSDNKKCTGSIGIYFDNDIIEHISHIIENDGKIITNQVVELLACIEALNIIHTKVNNKELNIKIIYLYTDSLYVINCMLKWYDKWSMNNWKTINGKDVKNKELIEILYQLKNKNILTIFKHIKAHQDEPINKDSFEYKLWYGNYMADKLATSASLDFSRKN